MGAGGMGGMGGAEPAAPGAVDGWCAAPAAHSARAAHASLTADASHAARASHTIEQMGAWGTMPWFRGVSAQVFITGRRQAELDAR